MSLECMGSQHIFPITEKFHCFYFCHHFCRVYRSGGNVHKRRRFRKRGFCFALGYHVCAPSIPVTSHILHVSAQYHGGPEDAWVKVQTAKCSAFHLPRYFTNPVHVAGDKLLGHNICFVSHEIGYELYP